MKNDQYFKIEVCLLSEDNVVRMQMELDPAKSLGIYVTLLMHLRKKDDYEASCSPIDLKGIAWQYHFDIKLVERLIHEFGLFTVDEERQTFRSPYLDKVMKSLEEKREIARENGKKGGRPPKQDKSAETPASKEEKPSEKQKSRVEDSREEESIAYVVYNNNSNREESVTPVVAAAVAVDLRLPSLSQHPSVPSPALTDSHPGAYPSSAQGSNHSSRGSNHSARKLFPPRHILPAYYLRFATRSQSG